MEIFQAFGLDVKLLIANLINFLLLVGILFKFGYRPILNFVEERRKKIEQGLNDAERAKDRLEAAHKEHEEIITAARKKAQNIMAAAKSQAEKEAQIVLAKTQAESRNIVNEAKIEIRLEQDRSLRSIREEASGLILLATEKILRKKSDKKADEEFIKHVLKEKS